MKVVIKQFTVSILIFIYMNIISRLFSDLLAAIEIIVAIWSVVKLLFLLFFLNGCSVDLGFGGTVFGFFFRLIIMWLWSDKGSIGVTMK